MKPIGHWIFGVVFMLQTLSAHAVSVDVHLGFATYDPIQRIFGPELYNPRLPNGDPSPLWVPSGTTVATYVYVDFNRTGSANGELIFSATIMDHDDGFLLIPGIDDWLAGPMSGERIPSVVNGGKQQEKQKLDPLIFYLERADNPGIRNVYSDPAGTIVESGLALSDFEHEDQDKAQTLEIIAPVSVREKLGLFDKYYEGVSTRFYLSVLNPREKPPLDGAMRIPAVPEPPTILLLALGFFVGAIDKYIGLRVKRYISK